MTLGQRCYAVAALAVAVASGISARAQSDPCVTGGVMGFISYGIGGSRDNIPFTGTVKTSFEQKLPDGNAIHRVYRTHEARDSAGRTMMETAQGCARGQDGQMHERFSVNVNDPVARTNMGWVVGEDGQPKVVRVYHQPDPLPRQTRPLQPATQPDQAEVERRQKMMQVQQAAELQRRREDRTEDLGVRDFNGVPAQGTRVTRTIPPGEEGNDQPLVVVNETWRSKELGLTLMGISDDPRRGRTVTEYEELRTGEPDLALFAPPAGYTVQEQPRNGVMSGMVGAILQ